ncbi:MAG: NAD(P)/FAD-dependent oxidoreductase [Treponema sp.]|nr:NAD(P)/FAD-dependent oxidoreductase [Treponema sp.]
MAKKNIIILGAGYSGVLTAKKLAKKIKKQNSNNVDVTIIDKNPFHTMLTELHEVAACRVDESSIRIDLKKTFEGRNVNVVMDTIVDTDFNGKQLTGKLRTYDYDYLVMATGCKTAYFGVKGAEENAFPLWSYEDAVRLRDHIEAMFRGAAVETNPECRKAMLTFYIVGGGFSGVEMAGELAEYAPILCDKFHIPREEVRIFTVDMLDRIMSVLPDKARERAMRRLAKIGVTVKLKANITGVSKDGIEYVTGETTNSDCTNTVIWTAGIQGSDIAQKSEALGLQPKTRGRIATDKYLRSLTHPNVYAAGDNIFYIPEGEERPVPQMVENCENCAPVIAENILAEITGDKPGQEYKPRFHGAMVCIGSRYGTAHSGMPGKFAVLPSFIAMLAKHFINVVYFMQVLGINKVLSYITNEFFAVRNRRSFLGGHFSNRGPLFLIVPLRVFLGLFFIYYAYRRYTLGWLDINILGPYFESMRGVFRPSLFQFELFNQFRFSLYVLNDYVHMWFQTTPFSWFVETFVIASEAQIMFWQGAIVVTTLLVGLALAGGLFTTLASLYVILYSAVYILSSGLAFPNMWLPFAGIAFLFIGGRVLALDYYVMPWLKKRWNNCAFAKKWYLYRD